MKQKVIVLQIRFSGNDNTIYVCKTFEIAHRIIREWFKDSIEDINHLWHRRDRGRTMERGHRLLGDYRGGSDMRLKSFKIGILFGETGRQH